MRGERLASVFSAAEGDAFPEGYYSGHVGFHVGCIENRGSYWVCQEAVVEEVHELFDVINVSYISHDGLSYLGR